MAGVILGLCAACGTPLQFNSEHCPDVPGDRGRPRCRPCHAEWNRRHRDAHNLPRAEAHPLAYER